MKKRHLAVISLAVYVLLLWLLGGIVLWLIAGLIAGLASSAYLSRVYDRAYAEEQQKIRAEGMSVDPASVIGEKTNTVGFFIVIGLILGILSFGIDSLLTTFISAFS